MVRRHRGIPRVWADRRGVWAIRGDSLGGDVVGFTEWQKKKEEKAEKARKKAEQKAKTKARRLEARRIRIENRRQKMPKYRKLKGPHDQ